MAVRLAMRRVVVRVHAVALELRAGVLVGAPGVVVHVGLRLVLAVFTAVSMTALTTGFGFTLGSRPVAAGVNAVAPALGALSLAFGVWYAAAAWSLVAYPF